MQIGNKSFETKKHTYIMGILNVTPDSFSDGGKFQQKDAALYRVQQMLDEGAHIIDIGGESTRPGHTVITQEEEIQRTAPIIELVKTRFDIPVSVDTYKAATAKAALQAGADLINDIWGLKHDPAMAELIAESGAACCLMHNRSDIKYTDFMKDMKQDLKETILLAEQAGISKEKMILDPGVGFAKSYENNLEIIYKLEELIELGYPLLLGTSRKSVLGLTLDLPVTERIEGTLVTTVLAVMKYCGFVRVHDIEANRRAIQMAEAIREGWKCS